MSRLTRRRAPLADDFLESYLRWREACVDVHSAYERWRSCAPEQRGAEFATYREALEIEESTAVVHAESTARLSAAAA